MTGCIVALDPGGTTGVSVYELEMNLHNYEINVEQIDTKESLLAVYDLLDLVSPDAVVCENFTYRQNDKAGIDLTAQQVIGVAKLWCEMYCVPLKLQQASAAKGFAPDSTLKKLGLYHVGKRHANDATRHLVYYIIKNKEYPYMELLEKGFKD